MRKRSHPDAPDQLVTSRLILRPFDRTDAKPHARMFADRRMWTFEPAYWKGGPRGSIRAWRRSMRSKKAYHFVIRMRDKSKFVGEIALHHLDWDNRHGEIGFHIVSSQWGKGIATESAYRLCDWAFRDLRLHRLEAETTEGNLASDAVLKKLGFSLEGRRPKRNQIGKKWCAAHQYGLLKSHFGSQRQ